MSKQWGNHCLTLTCFLTPTTEENTLQYFNQSNGCIGKSNYVLTRILEESCVITFFESHQTRCGNFVHLLKSTVEVYLFSLHIINVIPGNFFPHSMAQVTHALQITRALDVGNDGSQIMNLSLGRMRQKRACWKHSGFPLSSVTLCVLAPPVTVSIHFS